jgi:hypothetical protein
MLMERELAWTSFAMSARSQRSIDALLMAFAYLPLKRGARRCRKAATPSSWSAVMLASAN